MYHFGADSLIFHLSDIDECFSDPCHSNATCNNTIGSFTCTCVSGYAGDGIQCFGKYFICGVRNT